MTPLSEFYQADKASTNQIGEGGIGEGTAAGSAPMPTKRINKTKSVLFRGAFAAGGASSSTGGPAVGGASGGQKDTNKRPTKIHLETSRFHVVEEAPELPVCPLSVVMHDVSFNVVMKMGLY